MNKKKLGVGTSLYISEFLQGKPTYTVQRKLISYKGMTVCQFVIYRCTEKVFSLELKLL